MAKRTTYDCDWCDVKDVSEVVEVEVVLDMHGRGSDLHQLKHACSKCVYQIVKAAAQHKFS